MPSHFALTFTASEAFRFFGILHTDVNCVLIAKARLGPELLVKT
jgi:hypothetical protein